MPGGRIAGLMVTPALTVIWKEPEAVCCLASVTVAVNEKVPVAPGVPEMAPLGLSIKPGGKLPPVMAHVKGCVPPTALSEIPVYGTPTVAPGRIEARTVRLGAMAIWNCPVAVAWRESVTVAANVKVPVCVGVPLMTPPLLSDSPGGSPPLVTDHVNGGVPPEAFSAVPG